MKKWPFFLIIALSVFAAYSNTFQGKFHYDDFHYFVDNAAVKDLGQLLKGINGSRFMLFFTFWINFKLGGLTPWVYHLTNLVIHILSSMTVFLLLEAFLTLGLRDINRQYHQWAALFGALLFGLHPLQTMAVTYLSQRMASLAGLFYMLSVYFYLRGRQFESRPAYVGALVFCVLAMKTKENTFTLPFMVLLVEYAFFRGKQRRPLAVLALFLLSLAIIPLSDLEVHWDEKARDPGWRTIGTEIYTRGQYFATQMRVILLYMRLFVLPLSQNIDYDYRLSGSLFDTDAFLAALAHMAILAMAFLAVKRGGRLMLAGLGVLWFYIALSVESSIIPISDVVAEYRVYLPSFGISVAVAALALALGNPRKHWRVMAVAGAVVLAVFGSAAFSRNFVWATERSLWADTVRKSPNKTRPWHNYAVTLEAKDRIRIFEWILSREPQNIRAMNGLGQAYMEMGRLDEAEAILLSAGRIGQRRDNLASRVSIHIKRGEYQEAFFYLQRLLREEPGKALYNVLEGMAYEGLGRREEAERAYRKALRLNPSDVDALNNLGNLLADAGRLGESLELLEKASRLDPGSARVWSNLGATYAQMNDYDEALRALDRAITLDPKLPDAWFNKGVILWGAGKREAAIFAVKKALSINPDFRMAKERLRQWEGG